MCCRDYGEVSVCGSRPSLPWSPVRWVCRHRNQLGSRHDGTFLLSSGTALLGSMASPISARFCRTDLLRSQACRMWELRAETRSRA